MKNNDALKKHHFWILFGLIPLFVLIAVLVISSSVGGAIEKRNSEIEAAKKEIASKTNPKPDKLLIKMEQRNKTVDGKRGALWEDNWKLQKNLFTWPQSELFADFSVKPIGPDGKLLKGEDGKDKVISVARLDDLKFGDQVINTKDQFLEFRKKQFYLAQYSTAGLAPADKPPGVVGMADNIAPTQFKGGWEGILRHVNTWSEVQVTSDQLWLMMEDVWVQRSMLDAVKSVNDQLAKFERVKFEKDGQVIDDPNSTSRQEKLRRAFRSRIWEVALEVVTKGNKKYLVGSVSNITERLQVLGAGKTMILKVWLEGKTGPDGKLLLGPDGKPDVTGIEPVEFKVGTEILKGKGSTEEVVQDNKKRTVRMDSIVIEPNEDAMKDLDKYPNIIPLGKTVAEIVKVEQVFDSQTVPIRRIEAMALGKTDSHYGDSYQLKTPKFINLETADPAATPSGLGGPATGVPPGGMGSGFPPTSAPPGDPRGGTGLSTGSRSGGGSIETVVNANKKRYVDVTEQVRRMPVGIVVVVDQAYLQDVLLAFANSPLRFQITQVTWSRFRGSLGRGVDGSGSYGPDDVLRGGGSGDIGREFSPGGDGDIRSRPAAPRSPLGPIPPMSGGGTGTPTPPMGPPPGSSPPTYGSGSGMLTSVSDAQLTAGLIELSIYGTVSLYERYTPPADPKDKKDKEPDPKEPDPKDKKDKDPTDKKDKGPMEPMSTTPMPPKKRIRRAA